MIPYVIFKRDNRRDVFFIILFDKDSIRMVQTWSDENEKALKPFYQKKHFR